MSSFSSGPIQDRVVESSASNASAGSFIDLVIRGPCANSRAGSVWIPPAFVTLTRAEPLTGPIPFRSHLGIRDHLSWVQCGVEMLAAVVVVLLEPQIVPMLAAASIILMMSML